MTYPNERILLLIPPIPIKAKYMVIGSIVIELMLGIDSSGNVAHFAHLGGMLFGWLVIRYWRKHDNNRNGGFTSWEEYKPGRMSFSDRIRKKAEGWFKYNKPSDTHNFSDRNDDYRYNANRKADRDDIDRILEKIKRSGYDSLSDEEKKKLFDAGKK